MDRRSALLAAVYASPADDTPRSVLADHLIEQGDEYGELIALQLKRATTPGVAPTKREQALVKALGPQLAGGLSALFAKTDRTIERGFLTCGRADGAWKNTVTRSRIERTIGDPAWNTVTSFTCPPHWPSWLDDLLTQLFASPTTRALAMLHNITSSLALKLERAELPPPLVDLALRDIDDRELEELGAVGLPHVRRLIGLGAISVDRVARLWTAPIVKRLEMIGLQGYQGEPVDQIDEFLPAILEHAPASLREIQLACNSMVPSDPEGWSLAFTRDVRGDFTQLAARFGACSYGYAIAGASLVLALARLPATSLTTFRIIPTRAYKPTDADVAAIKRATGRFKRLSTVEIP